MKRGFTLMEVNLAMFVMAVGTLGLVSLYSFGYRESQQSTEDVRGAAVAEMNVNALIAALSSTNVSWSAWCGIGELPQNGWGFYAGDGSGKRANEKLTPPSDPTGSARDVFNRVKALGNSQAEFEDGDGLACGLVVKQTGDRCSISFRSGRRAGSLVYQPLYYTEVRYQGTKP